MKISLTGLLMHELSDQRIRHILSCSPAIIYTVRVHDPFNVTFLSENFSSHFGYSIKECLNNPEFWRENIHPDDCDCVFADHASLYKEGHHVHEYRFRKKDGDYLWVLDEIRLTRDAAGNPQEIVGSWLDITERKETEAALQTSEALFRDFFKTNPVATIITSPSGVIHMVNPAFTIHTDFVQGEVVGRTSQELGFWRDPVDRERMVAAIEKDGFIDNMEASFYGKGGKPMTCLVSSRAVEFGGEVRILSTVLDVTEQRKAEEALRKLDQAKSDFISTAAHELRTPLIAIVGYSELLENSGKSLLTEEQKKSYLSIIQSNAENLNHLVDDLLDVGRIQIGRPLGVVPKENQITVIIEKISESMRVRSQQHNIVIEHVNAPPQVMRFDSGRITQVFYNLISNAIKYSPLGGTIKIQTITDHDKILISVIDQGQGMTLQQVEHVFDRFYRAVSENAETSGLGLGMSIVKQIIDDHGGEIRVDSTPGEGTTVTFSLPIKQ